MRWLVVLGGFLACSPTRGDSGLGVVHSIDSATRAFEAAQRARDGERVVAHLDTAFYMYADGERFSYAKVAENIRRDFGTARLVEPGFHDIDVLVLAPEAGLASFRFRDSIVLGDGTLRLARGTTTLAWVRRGAEWRILHADAFHRVE